MIDILAVNILTCAGQLAQKQAASGEPKRGARQRHVIGWLGISLLCLGSAMLLWLSVLQRVPVGIAYPMLSLNFILVTLAARWFWHETITTRQWLGIALIVLGVIFVGRGA